MYNKELKYCKEVSLNLYEDEKIFELLDDINKKSFMNCELLKKLIEKKVFKVPYYKIDNAWGSETIYLPFTNKLFKIIETTKNNTSLQLHPLKNERWYPFKNVNIFDGKEKYLVKKNSVVDINKCAVHSLLKGSIVFEVQDNIPFEYKETLRLYDWCNREISPSSFYSYLMPETKNSIKLYEKMKEIEKQTIGTDSFIYSIDYDVAVKYNNETIIIKPKELWFLKEGTIITKNINNVILESAKYFNIK